MSNIQVTHDTNLNHARSESAIVVNPNNPLQIVAGSKRFNNIQTYDFTLATSFSTDGGHSWQDSADFTLPSGATVMTDPTFTWDDAGNVYSVGLVGKNPPAWDTIGIVVYKSTDGGQTWGTPQLIHSSSGDDKQWCAGDTNPGSSFHGRVYAVWDDGSAMRFARTKDHGATWEGISGQSAGSILVNDSFSPEINIAADGTVYIVWLNGINTGKTVKMLVSTNGGDSFSAPKIAADGITPAASVLPSTGGWPHLPGATFRVVTVPTACVFGKRVTVAWEDFREGVGRIYHAQSPDGGGTWTTAASGEPLIADPIPTNFHHFLPQIICDPAGVIGCSFYEFGPKPTSLLIDVMMAESYDGGSSYHYFTVTDQAWDPTVDAPWSHGSSSVTFIGDYFGIDASGNGFYPLWTDTRTGIQELWTAIVPERRCAFIIERSTFGQDEIDARRGQGSPVVPDAFRVVVDGFSAPQLGITGSSSTLNVASPRTGMSIVCTGNTSDTGTYGNEVQRFTFSYNVDFGPTDVAFNFPGATLILTLHAVASTVSAAADIELIKQPDPFILHGDPAWLSVDLRVFPVRSGESKFGITMGPDAVDAPSFIQNVIKALTNGHGSAGGQTFENDLRTDEQGSSLFVFPQDNNGKNVFNFAIAKVHYIGLIGASDVRVFFRMFQAQSTNCAFDASTTYRRAPVNPSGQPIALAGIKGLEYVTIPFFAEQRVNTSVESMDRQTDDPNVQNITAIGGPEVDIFFGCWLDINQPFNPVLPVTVDPFFKDGPFGFFGFSTPLSIQQAVLRNPHQCLVAEIAFDGTPIPFGKDPGNWDKLAQRNIAWSDLGSGRGVSTFEVRPTTAPPSPTLPADELMIDWGNLPKGSLATIYLPDASADEVLDLASRMYTTRRLIRGDDHTLHCKTGGITYVPVPYGSTVDYAGLLSIDLPAHVREGHAFNVVVRQVTNAFSPVTIPLRGMEHDPEKQGSKETKRSKKEAQAAASSSSRPHQWRRVLGAFQLTMPVHADHAQLLLNEERLLSVMKWIAETIPANTRWSKVFDRYLVDLGGRVKTFGGDPGQIHPSPTGGGKKPPHPPEGHGESFTGKIAGLKFDHFGDFEGLILETRHGEREFRSREGEIERLAEWAWSERLRITVHAEKHRPHEIASIVVHQPPEPIED